MLQQYLKPQGRQILLKCWLIDTLHPNKNCLKIYQGHVSSSVDATNMMFASIQRNEMRQLTQAAIIRCDHCVNTLGQISCKGSGRLRCHFGTNRLSFLEPSRWRTWKGEKEKIKFPKYHGYYYLYVASVKKSQQETGASLGKTSEEARW